MKELSSNSETLFDRDVSKMVPAPTKVDFASINRNQRKRLSKRELNITQHYDCSRARAGNTIKSDAIEVVPAPRLELGTP